MSPRKMFLPIFLISEAISLFDMIIKIYIIKDIVLDS